MNSREKITILAELRAKLFQAQQGLLVLGLGDNARRVEPIFDDVCRAEELTLELQ